MQPFAPPPNSRDRERRTGRARRIAQGARPAHDQADVRAAAREVVGAKGGLRGRCTPREFAVTDHPGASEQLVIFILIGPALLNAVKPYAYLRHLLERIAAHPNNRSGEFLPWNVQWLRPQNAWPRSNRMATARKTSSRLVKADAPVHQLRIGLVDVQPEVWRTVPSPRFGDATKVHATILWGMGWTAGHLHEFTIGYEAYRTIDPDFDDERPIKLEGRYPLAGAVGK